ncbi:hypothetical protein [Salinispora pacifica]|uniref:hypothetical protein n=1 Tax=Salinispora pacifica TaxID=351187 RepID=UPI000373A724|nr:hypothetical protein [Salinispora pacifica]
MTVPEENQDNTERTEPIVAAPTANPARVQVPPEGPGQVGTGEPEPAATDGRREEG